MTKFSVYRRVSGVCAVCTICFAIRAVCLLARISFGPLGEDIYFVVAEIAPTAYMLHIFQR
jgi:hypothetical protein